MVLPQDERQMAAGLRPATWLVVLGAMLAFATHAVAADIRVSIDEAKLERLPEQVTTLVIGNPLIADVAVQAGNVMVVTGKGFGSTNVIALDRNGKVLLDRSVEVVGPGKDVVVVYRGTQRETLACSPECHPRATLGDSPDYFSATLGQTILRSGQAQGGAAPAAAN